MNLSSFFPESDDLDAAINAPVREAPGDIGRLPTSRHLKSDREVFGVNRQNAFRETCAKCRGTGRYQGRSQHGSQCFECKGEGAKFFATSTEHRLRQRQLVAERKARKQAEAMEAFKAEQPAVWAWMEENVASDRPFEFAINMRDALAKYGSLTEKQLAACIKCVAKRAEAIQARKVEQVAREASVHLPSRAAACSRPSRRRLRAA